MKALILAGGKGTRLRPITHTSAKQLVPVANKPVLFYGIEAIRNAGIKDIVMIVGQTREEIKEACGTGDAWDVNITYVYQEEPLGLAHCVKIAKDELNDEPFVMYLGDNLIKGGITPFVRQFEQQKPNAQILLAKVPDPQRFGVAELDGDRVTKLVEKPKEPKSDLALVGVYMFDPNIYEAVDAIKPSWRNELEITDAIQYLVENDYDVRSHVITGWWKDTGNLGSMLEANRIVLDELAPEIHGTIDEESEVFGKISVGEGSKIVNSTIRGPAVIGENCTIENSFIGPFTSIYNDVKIESSEIEHSIVLEESQILHIDHRIEDSLIGKNVKVTKTELKPKALRFMLGDNSEVGVL